MSENLKQNSNNVIKWGFLILFSSLSFFISFFIQSIYSFILTLSINLNLINICVSVYLTTLSSDSPTGVQGRPG